ncbi:dephospho-CoA kinase [Tenacibaculum maritimum]|uniref:dephospho-CoA kinase n=1 Tax=Tenacibaculum maritimum TaxID=107401 RepID=UPI00388FFFBB
MVVGLTGGIGSGKTTVLKEFHKFDNIAIYIADIEAKKLMNNSNEIREKITNEFGKKAFLNEQLNRPFLANIVFSNKEKLATLNAIVHPVVTLHFKNFIAANRDKAFILYENAILFENKSNLICDKIITVTAPKELRIQRVLKRDQSSENEIINRMNNQWSDTKKTLQSHYIIENIDFSETMLKVFEIHNKLTKMST